jgi:hypothetical protein
MNMGGQQIRKMVGCFFARLDSDDLVTPGVAAGKFDFDTFTNSEIPINELQVVCLLQF